MAWQVRQGRGQWYADVVRVGDPACTHLRGTRVAVVLSDNVDFKNRHFTVDADWWQRPSFDGLIADQAIILIRHFEGLNDVGSALVGDKIGMFRIENVRRDGTRLSFDLAERLKGGIE